MERGGSAQPERGWRGAREAKEAREAFPATKADGVKLKENKYLKK